MRDRTPKYPGRIYIEPEDGSTPYFAKVTQADGATEPGTEWSRENVLPEWVTREIFGSRLVDYAPIDNPFNPTPADAFYALSAIAGRPKELVVEFQESTMWNIKDNNLNVGDVVDVYMVGGGAAGGSNSIAADATASGGGGGHCRLIRDFVLEHGNYPIVVGAGGVGTVGTAGNGGGSTSALGITVAGGNASVNTTSTIRGRGGSGGSGGGGGGFGHNNTLGGDGGILGNHGRGASGAAGGTSVEINLISGLLFAETLSPAGWSATGLVVDNVFRESNTRARLDITTPLPAVGSTVIIVIPASAFAPGMAYFAFPVVVTITAS